MRFDIKKKFMIANIAIILPMFILFIYFSVVLVDQYNLESARKTLLNDSYILQLYLYQYLAENSAEDLQEKDLYFLNYRLSKMINLRTQLHYISNNIQVDSALNEHDIFSEFKESQEIKLAENNKKNYRLTKSNGHRYLLMTFPFYSQEELKGTVRLIYSLEEVDNQKKKLIRTLSFIGFIVLTVIILLYLYFTQKIVSPLYKLKAAVKSFASGRHSKIEIDSGDEIEELAASFNKMAEEIGLLIDNLRVEKNKQKDFYNSMTHEIRTPLTTILGYADIIKRLDSQEDRETCLVYIESEGKRLLRMINELLKSSKLNLYDFEIKKDNCDLAQLLQETTDIIQYQANKYGIKLNLQRAEKIYIDVDRDKIKEVILNLLDNAIKYSSTDKIDVSLEKYDQEILIKVRDYGQGITQYQLDKFNSKFTGLQINDISNPDGHGFGLSISRKIIELHGGQFIIKNLKGRGTLVVIRLYK